MPSKKQGEELRGIIKNIRDGTFEYESKGQVLTNWAQYDQAQIHEMANYLDDIRDLVEEADKRIKDRMSPRKRGPGRPPTDPADVAKALLLQTYVDSSNRLAEGFFASIPGEIGHRPSFFLQNNRTRIRPRTCKQNSG